MKYLDQKISEKEIIIQDYIQTEEDIASGLLNYIKNLRKKSKKDHALATEIIELHQEISSSAPYDKELKNKLLFRFGKKDYGISHAANIRSFNKACKDIITQNAHKLHQNKYAIVVDSIKSRGKDSIELSITPIQYIEDKSEIQFYIGDKPVDRDAINKYKGDKKQIKVRITNPITGAYKTIKANDN